MRRTLLAICLGVGAVACSSVDMITKQASDGRVTGKAPMQVVSLLSLHPLGPERLSRDTRRFVDELVRALRGEGIDATGMDVEGLVAAHGLPVDVAIREERAVRRVDGVLPEASLLAVLETPPGTRRLVLYPEKVMLDGASGAVVGIVAWRLEGGSDGVPLASGTLRYVADARGFPSASLARRLVEALTRQDGGSALE